MRKALHIVLAVTAVLVAVAGCRGPKLIPRSKLADIYFDMFLADQQIREDTDLRNRADTMLVYEGIFNRYGYDTDDYLYSVRTYLKDPERFSKTLENVADRLQAEADRTGKEVEHLDWVNRFMRMRRPPVDSVLLPFSEDSLYVGLARVVRDTNSAAWFKLEGVQKDTLMP